MFVDEKAVGEPQPVQIGALKLSTAIRIGAKLRPKCEVALHAQGRSCALGAAYEAATGKICGVADYSKVRAAFPGLKQRLMDQITDRNDGVGGYGEMTREEIADWLESKGH